MNTAHPLAATLAQTHRLSLDAALERAARSEPVAWLYTYPHDGEQDHCLSLSRFLPSWVEAKGASETPLYALAALPGGVVARFARGIAHDWKGGGRTGIYFDGDFDVELMRSYYLIPTPNPHEADRNG